jgi:hypothetical protein
MPYFWPYPDVPEPKWPEPHPDATYKEGMTPKQYLDHLCRVEAGEFIYKTVSDVESLYFVRLHARPRFDAEYSREAMEDPYNIENGLTWSTAPGHALGGNIPNKDKDRVTLILKQRRYRYFEAPQPYFRDGIGIPHHDKLYSWGDLADLTPNDFVLKPKPNRHANRTMRSGTGTRYVRLEKNPDEVTYIRRSDTDTTYPWNFVIYSLNGWYKLTYTDQIVSRYGVVWRGIQRPRDRDMNIAGGELIVLDLQTNEILGVSRGFVMGNPTSPRFGGAVDWSVMTRCPITQDEHGNKFIVWPWPFIRRVLQPVELQLPTPVDEPPEYRPPPHSKAASRSGAETNSPSAPSSPAQ